MFYEFYFAYPYAYTFLHGDGQRRLHGQDPIWSHYAGTNVSNPAFVCRILCLFDCHKIEQAGKSDRDGRTRNKKALRAKG